LAKDKSTKTPENKHPFQNFLKPSKPVFEESAEPKKKRPTIPFDKRSERPKSTAFDERVKKAYQRFRDR
jgi:hypothetical protein